VSILVLILHSSIANRQRPLASARAYADKHGERLLLLMTNPTYEAPYFDRVATADTTDIEATVAAAKELANDETEPIRAVITFAESGVPAAARIAAELGVPGISPDSAYLARDKYAMRTAYAEAGVPQPGYGLARTVEEGLSVAADIGYPVVLKPIIGLGSGYVRSVDTPQELSEHFDALRAGAWDGFSFDPLHAEAHERYGGAILVEEFVGGPEISVESIVADGTTHSIAIHDKPLPTGPTFEEVYACTPTRLPRHVVERVYEATKAVHAAMGITVGATHVEFRIRNGEEPIILEAAARMGGGPIYRSVQLSTGVDMVAAWLDAALGRTPDVTPVDEPRAVGFYNIFPDKPGVLTAIHGWEEAKAHPKVEAIDFYKKVGDYLDIPPTAVHCHGYCIFLPGTVEELDDTFTELTRLVRLETEG
jgi:biotin carboxylase